MPRNKFTLLVLVLLTSGQAFSQTQTQTEILRKAGEQHAAKERSGYERLKRLAEQKRWPLSMKSRNGGIAVLTGTDRYGNPVYLSTESNQVAAATIGTSKLWEGGSLGLNLSGSSNAVKNKMALWDGGRVLATHVELTGRITNKDVTANSDHATHVAGTMMATGVNPVAKGMAYKMQAMDAYDFSNHISEMLTASTSLLVSNHSYGEKAGWVYNETESRWEFWGPYDQIEDPRFGMYTEDTQIWDSIAYNAPYYLIVKSSGNNRDENGPAVGAEAWRFNQNNVMTKIQGGRPAGISSNDSYDIISSYGTAKNILTVGAVEPIPQGYSSPADVVMSSFSSWGPTDDGRIKPDVVADGVNLTSSIASSNNAYATFSGTSMATPNVTGSLILLQEYYQQLHPGTFMRSATLKGLVIHTADEAGPSDGPDYQNGWGLVNVAKAALVIKDDNSPAKKQLIQENTLSNGNTYTFTVIASGSGPLVATICWTDPKGAVTPDNSLNDPTPKLVHDLDLRITEGANTYMPWKLDPIKANRALPATKGDNTLDNVEKIEIPNPIPGRTYTIKVTHKGTLARGSQAFSLIVSGVGGAAACTNSGPTDANGARINGIKLNNLNYTAASTTTCTQYVDNTASVASVETNTTYSTNLTIGTCGGENLPSIAFKVFADLNGNGVFDLPNELLYTSTPVTPGTPTYTATFNLPIPAGVTTGQYILTRIVLVETTNAGAIASCGSYGKGETQDFLLKVSKPSKDVGVSEILSPVSQDCASGPQNVSIRIRNTGSSDQSNVPFSFKLMKGATTVLNTTGTFPGTVKAGGEAVYTLQNTFTPEAGATYQVESETTLANDQDQSNNKTTATVTIAQATQAPTGASAEICGNTVNFKATATNNDVYFWYDALNATKPIAGGTKTSSNVITADKKYYIDKNNSSIHVGPASNGTLSTTGSYNVYDYYFMSFNNTAPVLIESARLFIGKGNSSGKATVMVARNVTIDGSTISFIPEATTVIDVYPTHPTPGSTTYSANDKGAVFQLNLPVTTTGDHAIMMIQDNQDNATFFANSNIGTNPYPTGIPGVFTFTGNIRSQLSTKDPEKYYYIFYDMKLRYINCPSSDRNEVTATTAVAPVITQTGNSLTSSAATGNQWYKNTVLIPGATGQTYTPTSSGTYVSVVTNGSCSLSSNEINFTVTSVPNVDPAAIGLRILPNPSDGRFVADFTVNRKADLNISILNTIGQKVHEVNYPGFVGRFNKTIEAAHLSTGVYMLRIQHDNKSYLTKLIIR
jgi:hypothetical protein